MKQLIKKSFIILTTLLLALAVIACDSSDGDDDDDKKSNTTDFVNEGTEAAPTTVTVGTPYSGQVADTTDTVTSVSSYYEVSITAGQACTVTLSGIDEFTGYNNIAASVYDKQNTSLSLTVTVPDGSGNQVAQLSASQTTGINTLLIEVRHSAVNEPGGDYTLTVTQ